MQIFHAVDAGELSEDEAGMLVRSFLSAGIDTTVYGLGNALYCMARYGEQWQTLRDNPNLIRNGFEEVLRFEAPVQTFFRTTTKPVEVGGVQLGEGEKVLLFSSGGQPRPAPLGRARYVRREPPRGRAHDVRHRYPWLRRTGGGPAGDGSDPGRAGKAGSIVRADSRAEAATEQYATRL